MEPIRLLSLFSGIGAFEKALTVLGIPYELVGYSEIDKFASRNYAILHNVSESLNLGDITLINPESLPENIDLVTYGFPCNDLSVAGRMRGFEDENGRRTRSGLFFDALRIIKAVRPRIAVAENVKALGGKRFQKEFETVLGSLASCDFKNYHALLNAKDFGIPQNRERIFIVSIRADMAPGGFNFPRPLTLKSVLRDFLEEDVPAKYYLSQKMIAGFARKRQNRPELGFKFRLTGPDAVAPCINATYGKCAPTNCYVAGDLNRFRHELLNRVYGTNGLAPTLTAMRGGYTQPKILMDFENEE